MDKRKWKQKNKRKQQQQQLALETKFGKKMILTMVTLNDQYRYGFQHIFLKIIIPVKVAAVSLIIFISFF